MKTRPASELRKTFLRSQADQTIPIRMGIVGPDSRQPPILTYHPQTGRWRIWLMYSPDVVSGTYLDMYPDGMSERVTTKDGYIQSITRTTNPIQDL